MAERGATVTAAEIARLAGVGRAAVSNWRRRSDDFPQPVGGSATSPLFDLAEVEAWLRDHGKLGRVPAEERAWQRIRAAYDELRIDAIGQAGAFLVYLRRGADHTPGLAAPPGGAAAADSWRRLRRTRDDVLAARLPHAVAAAVADLPVLAELPHALDPRFVPVLREIAALADAHGPAGAYDLLVARYAQARRAITPSGWLADLMARLAAPEPGSEPTEPEEPARRGTVLDPACATGALLLAAHRLTPGPPRLLGQDINPTAARVAAARLALRDADAEIHAGDALRADAFAGRPADAVVTLAPRVLRAWGQVDLGYDPRWEYGVPPRGEAELAWVQHALAHARPGGHVVVALPATVAARPAGRRIRAALLRAGALRAVVALPASAIAGIVAPSHLWVLRRPDGQRPDAHRLLLADLGGEVAAPVAPPVLPGPGLVERVLAMWRAFQADPLAPPGPPETCRSTPVIDLLDEQVDLTPAPRLAPPPRPAVAPRVAASRPRLSALLADLAGLVPDTVPATRPTTPAPSVSVAELARAGALTIHQSHLRGEAVDKGGLPLLTARDVIAGRPPSERVRADDPLGTYVTTRAGDVVVPVLTRQPLARVLEEGGAVLGPQLFLLRVDPRALDPYFLAGFLRGADMARPASSLSGTFRVDVRRVRLPRLPLAAQRAYGRVFRRLAKFERALGRAGELGREYVELVTAGLVDGSLAPPDEDAT